MTSLLFPILIGDIGGTNARFAILNDAGDEERVVASITTKEYATVDEALRIGVLPLLPQHPRSAIFAIAAPIEGDEIPLTNHTWILRPLELIENLGFDEVLLINDFEAQALAVSVLKSSHRENIGGVRPPAVRTRIVLGPGTGLGAAGLVRHGSRWLPVPGEGGHVDIGARSDRDYQIFPFLERIDGRISAEQLLCGRGLVNIYRAICTADSIDPVFSLPSEITRHGLTGGDPQAAETLQLFSVYLGRLAGDFALMFMATGGVFLAGGISEKLLPALKSCGFRHAFEDKAPHKDLLAAIPTFVVTHPFAALVGIAGFARNPREYHLNFSGRRWLRSNRQYLHRGGSPPFYAL